MTSAVEITDTSIDNSSSTPDESNSSAIEITDLSLSEEWIQVTNNGEKDVSLEKWYITDEASHKFVFPEYTLQSGKSVTIYTAKGTDTNGELYWGRSNVWNNDGDVATLHDADEELIDKYEK